MSLPTNLALNPYTTAVLLLKNEEGEKIHFIKRKIWGFPFFKASPAHECEANTSEQAEIHLGKQGTSKMC